MGGGGEWVESCSWFLDAASVSSPAPTVPEGCPGWLGGPQADQELGSRQGTESIRKARKITPTVKQSSVGRIQMLLSAFHR